MGGLDKSFFYVILGMYYAWKEVRLWQDPQGERVIKLKNSFKVNLVSIDERGVYGFNFLVYGDIGIF